jgi:nucleoside-diphosphate-sugar epimerase
MNIFVTGATGFLGKRLLTKLKQNNHAVTALSRSKDSDAVLMGLGAKVVSGSLSNIEEWEAALEGQDVVIHAASPIEVWGEWDMFEREIVLATGNLYRFSAKRGVKRFIYISTEAVLQDRQPLLDVDETLPYPDEPNSYYGKAKKLAELALLNSTLSTERIILRFPFLWGRGDQQLEKMIAKIRAGQFVWIDQGQVVIDMVHVENAVEAIQLALTGGTDKSIYFVTDDRPMTAKEFFVPLLKKRGITTPDASLPSWLARPAASMIEAIWRWLGIQSVPPLSRFQLDFIGLPRRYKLDKVKRELGYKPVFTLELGLKEFD